MHKNTRKCSRCKIVKDLCSKNFSQDKGRKLGFAYWCKLCANKYNHVYTKNHAIENNRKAKKWRKNNPLLYKFKEYKNSAKRRGIIFPLTIEAFENIIKEPCHFCGTHYSNGIDRKDNSQGYLLENCLPCCEYCNRAKYTRSYEDFLLWIEKLIHYQTTGLIGTKALAPDFYA